MKEEYNLELSDEIQGGHYCLGCHLWVEVVVIQVHLDGCVHVPVHDVHVDDEVCLHDGVHDVHVQNVVCLQVSNGKMCHSPVLKVDRE